MKYITKMFCVDHLFDRNLNSELTYRYQCCSLNITSQETSVPALSGCKLCDGGGIYARIGAYAETEL